MQFELEQLEEIFEEVLLTLRNGKQIKRIRKYSKRLKNISDLELNLAITFELMPYFVSDTMEIYIQKELCKKFKVDLSYEIKDRIRLHLNSICRIKLME